MAHHRQTRPDPNVSDPLSEPTVGRRVWAAYLRAGFNRSRFAADVGHTYKTQDNYDIGATPPDLRTIMRAAELSGFTLDELVYGRNPPRAGAAEAELNREAIKVVLLELRATIDQIEALGSHERSAAGQYQRFTRSYVTAFVERFALARREGLDVSDAVDAAKVAAANARANAEAIAARVTAPIGAEGLAALGRKLSGNAAKETAAKPRDRRRA